MATFPEEWVFCARAPGSFTVLSLNQDAVVAIPVKTVADTDPPEFWVCIPSAVWGHRWDNRPIPRAEVVKAVNVTIEVSEESGDSSDGDTVPLRVTLVRCKADAIQRFEPLHDREVGTGFMTENLISVLPSGAALLEAMPAAESGRTPRAAPQAGQDEAAGFGTAQSGQEEPTPAPSKAGPPMESRMTNIEQSLGSLQTQLADFMNLVRPDAKSPPPPPKSAAPAVAVELGSPLDSQLGSLNLSTQQLSVVRKMLHMPSRMQRESKAPGQPSGPLPASVLEESEDEVPTSPPAPASLEQAVSLLTQIVSRRSEQDRPRDPMSRLYDQLIPSLGVGTEAAPAFSMAKGSQGYIAFKKILQDHPDLIMQMIETNMAKRNKGSETNVTTQGPPSALFYAEHRSVITAHVANANWGWAMAAIADLLAEDPPRVSAARARALLGVACAEQVSLDGGSWVYAADLIMHDQTVPMSTLASHDPSAARSAHSELVDPQMFEVISARIKALEDAQERKKKILGVGQKPPPALKTTPPRVKAKAKWNPPQKTDQDGPG